MQILIRVNSPQLAVICNSKHSSCYSIAANSAMESQGLGLCVFPRALDQYRTHLPSLVPLLLLYHVQIETQVFFLLLLLTICVHTARAGTLASGLMQARVVRTVFHSLYARSHLRVKSNVCTINESVL